MSDPDVAIVGSGIAGAAVADLLTRRGYTVDLFEKGPPYPYPHAQPFEEAAHLYENPAWRLEDDLQGLTMSGTYRRDLNRERIMAVGGSGARWGAMADRFAPNDFRTQSLYGFGADWPIDYATLEPYYVRAERLMGVSGTDAGDPFAPPRSAPYPLPPFELGWDAARLAARLRDAGIVMRTSPQARLSRDYDGRPACANFGGCAQCPTGARYSSNHHVARAQQTGRCRVHTRTSVRRVLVDASGRARGLLVQGNDDAGPREHGARAVVLAAGTFESVRLLLLSRDERWPDGLGNATGQLGRHLAFHHIAAADVDYDEPLFAGRTGPEMAQSRQFADPPGRGRHGGVLLQLPSAARLELHSPGTRSASWRSGADVVEAMRPLARCEILYLHAESVATEDKHARLGEVRDRFGDPFLHVHYQSCAFDEATQDYAREIALRVARATGARGLEMRAGERITSGFHHMGGTRMSAHPRDGVVDGACAVHGTRGLVVAGGSTFAGTTPFHPTLTIAALALRAADVLIARGL